MKSSRYKTTFRNAFLRHHAKGSRERCYNPEAQRDKVLRDCTGLKAITIPRRRIVGSNRDSAALFGLLWARARPCWRAFSDRSLSLLHAETRRALVDKETSRNWTRMLSCTSSLAHPQSTLLLMSCSLGAYRDERLLTGARFP